MIVKIINPYKLFERKKRKKGSFFLLENDNIFITDPQWGQVSGSTP
jgi:hypothetical protein